MAFSIESTKTASYARASKKAVVLPKFFIRMEREIKFKFEKKNY